MYEENINYIFDILPGYNETLTDTASLYKIHKLSLTKSEDCKDKLLLDNLIEMLNGVTISSVKEAHKDIIFYFLNMTIISVVGGIFILILGAADKSRPLKGHIIVMLNFLFFTLGIYGICVFVLIYYSHITFMNDRERYKDISFEAITIFEKGCFNVNN